MDPNLILANLSRLAEQQEALLKLQQQGAPTNAEQLIPWVVVTVLGTLVWLLRRSQVRAEKAQDQIAATLAKIAEREAADTEKRTAAWVAAEARLAELTRAMEREATASRGEMVRLGNWVEGAAAEIRDEVRRVGERLKGGQP